MQPLPPPNSYYCILLQRYPALPADVKLAMDLYDSYGWRALTRIRHCEGEFWQSVRVNLKRMNLQWQQAVRVLS